MSAALKLQRTFFIGADAGIDPYTQKIQFISQENCNFRRGGAFYMRPLPHKKMPPVLYI